ncbi:ER lumen protein-retaining receptor-like [Aristolochia californica]|uniref:ER lumen protein-retaining receptor-like n=1 Tax=Aristolochia californica TaxID=171875 RepID=UPI0035D60B32
MNVFRLAGDMTHLLSIILLLLKIRTMKSCSGISLKTQELYVLVFAARYLDLFTSYVSFYNTVMKLVFLGTSVGIVLYMRFHKVVRQTYNKDEDTFQHFFLVLPCFLLALMINRDFAVMEVLWAFSLYLEAVAILPQLVMLQRSSNIDNLTGNYVFLLGAYRALYLFNWVYRFIMENHQTRWIPWISGLVQTVIYTDFFYYYIKSWKTREKLKLPA